MRVKRRDLPRVRDFHDQPNRTIFIVFCFAVTPTLDATVIPIVAVTCQSVSARNSGSATPCQYPKLGFRYTVAAAAPEIAQFRRYMLGSTAGVAHAMMASRPRKN